MLSNQLQKDRAKPAVRPGADSFTPDFPKRVFSGGTVYETVWDRHGNPIIHDGWMLVIFDHDPRESVVYWTALHEDGRTRVLPLSSRLYTPSIPSFAWLVDRRFPPAPRRANGFTTNWCDDDFARVLTPQQVAA